jgi:hypothetical protein
MIFRPAFACGSGDPGPALRAHAPLLSAAGCRRRSWLGGLFRAEYLGQLCFERFDPLLKIRRSSQLSWCQGC